MATTASLPVLETTESFTEPFWMYKTSLPMSPWEKMVSFSWNSTMVLATPAESRNPWTSKLPPMGIFVFFAVLMLLEPLLSWTTCPAGLQLFLIS